MCMEDIRINRRTQPRSIVENQTMPVVLASAHKIPGNPMRVALSFGVGFAGASGITLYRTGNNGLVPFASFYIGISVAGIPRDVNVAHMRIEEWGQLLTNDIFVVANFSNDPLTITELSLQEN